MSLASEATKGEGIVKRKKWRTLFALAFGYFIDQGEGQVMSVFTPVLKSIWGLSNTNVGMIGFIRSLLQALSAPFWGYAADKFSRRKVLLWGTGIWGLWTAVCGLTQNFGQLITIRAISGIGLGCLMPATFSIMADTFPPKQRGKTLGILEAVGVLGIIIGTLGLGFLATETLWRWGFVILGFSSVVSGLMIWFLVDEPVRGEAEPELQGKITEKDAEKYKAKFSDIKKVLKIPTIWVAIGQGLSGSMPWVVMGLFMILWLVEERGLTTQLSTIVFAAIVLGTAISNVLGGILGDWAESKSPKYGRTIVGQISIISGVPLTYILFTKTADWPLWGIVLLSFLTALLISWPGKGSKEPMMQGVVTPELRSTAFSVTMFIESGFAAIAALVVGSLADKIGLSKAMVWMVPVPWILCALLFSLFYWTYPKDSKKLRDEMAIRGKEIDLAHQKISE
ncbi:MAG: MFS transporter [Anaerolineaceae bacterium]|nr:MFS transporter [Anaerolineaceae bacterium]